MCWCPISSSGKDPDKAYEIKERCLKITGDCLDAGKMCTSDAEILQRSITIKPERIILPRGVQGTPKYRVANTKGHLARVFVEEKQDDKAKVAFSEALAIYD